MTNSRQVIGHIYPVGIRMYHIFCIRSMFRIGFQISFDGVAGGRGADSNPRLMRRPESRSTGAGPRWPDHLCFRFAIDLHPSDHRLFGCSVHPLISAAQTFRFLKGSCRASKPTSWIPKLPAASPPWRSTSARRSLPQLPRRSRETRRCGVELGLVGTRVQIPIPIPFF